MTSRPMRGVIPAVLTPMSRLDGSVDHPVLERSLDLLIDRGVDAVFVGGTMGEGPLLLTSEREELAQSAVRAANGRVPVGVHVGAMTTTEAIRLARHACDVGAAAVAAVPPFYYGYGHEELRGHFVSIARTVAPLPMYLYNLPAYCRNHISPELLVEAAQEASNIVGIKESSGDLGTLLRFIDAAGDRLDIICGADHLIASAFEHRAIGTVSSGAAVFPELYRPLLEGGAAAAAAQRNIDAVQEVLGRGVRVSRYKECWRLQGLDMGTVRPPASDVSHEESEQIAKAFADGVLPRFAID